MHINIRLVYRYIGKIIFIGCISSSLGACIKFGSFCDDCGTPKAAISELKAHGVTITTHTKYFPESLEIDVTIDAEYALSSPLEYLDASWELLIVFSPAEDKAITQFPTDNEWDVHPYAYSFSELVNGQYVRIRPILPHNYSVAPTTDLTTAYAPLRIENYPKKLVVYGNHLLRALAAFPRNATHIEVWHRQQRENELALVRRVALENLYAWRQYIEPNLDKPAVIAIEPNRI